MKKPTFSVVAVALIATASPVAGKTHSNSICAGLQGRAGKKPAPYAGADAISRFGSKARNDCIGGSRGRAFFAAPVWGCASRAT